MAYPYEPWSLLNQLQKELARSQSDKPGEGSIATAEWTPAVDIKEDNERFVIHADITGVKPDDIEISMEGGVLTVKGEKSSESKTEKEGYKRVERTSGMFYRRFSLPDSANAEAINASTKNGVLEIVIPKKEPIKPKRINITSMEWTAAEFYWIRDTMPLGWRSTAIFPVGWAEPEPTFRFDFAQRTL